MNGNPYYIKPGMDYSTGLQGLQSTLMQKKEMEKKDAIVKKAEDERLASIAAAKEAYLSNDPEKIAVFSLEHPEWAEKMKIADLSKHRDKETWKNSIDSMYEFLADPTETNAMKIVSERKKFLNAKGVAPEDQAETDRFLAEFETDPEATIQKVRSRLAAVDTEKFSKYDEVLKNKKELKDLDTGYRTYLLANDLENSPENYNKYQSFQAEQKKKTKGGNKERPYLAELMAEGYIPSTRITGPMMDALEAAAQKAAENGTPLTVDRLREMEFNAVKNRATGQSAGSRLTIARKQNIEAAYGLLKDMKVTSKKLNYSPVKFIASLEKWKNGQLQNPIFTEYMNQRADGLFILGNALKQNGLTDKSIEVEEEAQNPTLSPEAFEAWYNTQIRALNRAAEEMNKDYSFEISTMPSVPAGQGGVGEPTMEPGPQRPKYQEGQTATGPNGEKVIFSNGQWGPM